jgi:hypothetical protein
MKTEDLHEVLNGDLNEDLKNGQGTISEGLDKEWKHCKGSVAGICFRASAKDLKEGKKILV